MAHQDELGKMFVGGLSWETSQEDLCQYFARYGEVIDSVVMKNNETGRSRGFGFVTFKDPTCVQIVLDSGPHILDSRTVDPKACNPRTQQKPTKARDKNSYPKIFLGGLPSNVTETELSSHFAKYGNVVEVVIMYDQEKKRTRGFGFVSFMTEDSVDQVCAEQYVAINGKQVECKKAEPRENSRGGGGGFGGGGGGGGGGFVRRGNRDRNGGGPMKTSRGMAPMGGGGGPQMGPSAMGMPNGMGYQAQGWGPPQAGYPPQGAWMPSTVYPGPYGAPAGAPGYPGWGAQPYGPYGAPPPQYGPPQGYTGYGYGYNWGGPVPQPVTAPTNGNGNVAASQPAANHYGSPAAASAAAVSGSPTKLPGQENTASSPIKQEYSAYSAYGSAATSYPQQSSNFGPSRTYDNNNKNDGGHDNYNSSTGSYSAAAQQSDSSQSNSYNGSSGRTGGSQSYHPYRR